MPHNYFSSTMDSNQFENDIPSDALDALADLAYEQRQAMMEEFTDPSQLTNETITVTTKR